MKKVEPITRWNGTPTQAHKVRVVVGDSGFFPRYWARKFVGQEREAVQVTYDGDTFYLDNEDGSGWYKVTNGGGPNLPHRSLDIQRVVLTTDIGKQ